MIDEQKLLALIEAGVMRALEKKEQLDRAKADTYILRKEAMDMMKVGNTRIRTLMSQGIIKLSPDGRRVSLRSVKQYLENI